MQILKTALVSTALMMSLVMTGCASFVAKNTSGTLGTTTSSGERSLGQAVTDKMIARNARVNMYKLDTRFRQARVNIESFHGVVLITGQVPDVSLKNMLTDMVSSMQDVKGVHNFITVEPVIGYSAIATDLAITAKARTVIVAAPVVSINKVLLQAENGTLYVMGKLNNNEINDLNNVLQKVTNATRIMTMIDNIENIASTNQQNNLSIGLGSGK